MPPRNNPDRRKSLRSKIRWIARAELSAAQAAYVVATGARCVDPKTERLLAGPVTEINNRLLSTSIDIAGFWKQYLHERISESDVATACTVALMSSGCSEMQVEQTGKAIKNRLSEARSAFLSRHPKLEEQLELRARPLRERWEAFGEGLLREIERQVWQNSPPEGWWPSRVTGLLLQPLRGGDGGCDGPSETFWIEAMLTDADPRVPEVLRVAWLMTRMAIENHSRQRSGDTTLLKPWSYASVPLVLVAATGVELIQAGQLPTGRAMELWHFGDPLAADTVTLWWDEFQQTKEPLPVALRKLNQSLSV